MARLARVVVPGVAHHITQRGNRRQQTFFRDEDYLAYLALLEQVKDWRQYLTQALAEAPLWRRHEQTGRPLGEAAFLARIERLRGRTVRPAKRGPKPKRRIKYGVPGIPEWSQILLRNPRKSCKWNG